MNGGTGDGQRFEIPDGISQEEERAILMALNGTRREPTARAVGAPGADRSDGDRRAPGATVRARAVARAVGGVRAQGRASGARPRRRPVTSASTHCPNCLHRAPRRHRALTGRWDERARRRALATPPPVGRCGVTWSRPSSAGGAARAPDDVASRCDGAALVGFSDCDARPGAA